MTQPLCTAFSRVALGALLCALAPWSQAAPAKAGEVFTDCKPGCPEMVVLPAGSFTMGTPDGEQGREDDEGPLHTVTFAKPFAVSRFQVLNGQWQAYLADTGYTMPSGDDRPGRECIAGVPRYSETKEYKSHDAARYPAVCMNYREAEAYAAWLSKKTGQHYRLLSEAEREYAARAGSTGPQPFPRDPGKPYSIAQHANTYGPEDGFSYIAPAGSYAPNAFGIYDAHGNVYEWTADCQNDTYEGAPSDGSAWTAGDCVVRMIRGNDWTEAPIFSRSGNRNYRHTERRGDWLGFRVAREL
nr:formylglycine-generating enzyme family protein [uncultured Pseudomonas sp.]